MEIIFPCSHSISHSFASLIRSISMWTLEDKFHISARPYIILYIICSYDVTGADFEIHRAFSANQKRDSEFNV